MMGLMGAIFAALYFLPISPGALAIGFSVFLISIAIETVTPRLQRLVEAHQLRVDGQRVEKLVRELNAEIEGERNDK